MPCESRVVIIRDKQGRVRSMDLVCDGVCTGGRCRKIETDKREVADEELQLYGIKPKEGCWYRTYLEKCACVDKQGHAHREKDEPQRCCQITLRGIVEVMPFDSPDPNTPPTAIAIIIKKVIQCEKREGEDCKGCTCERFKVKDSVHEVVDENGEVTGTAESVICRCL